MINKTHIGAYAVIIKDQKILFIEKSRGVYKGKLDLPGGRLEFGEPINQALTREVIED